MKSLDVVAIGSCYFDVDISNYPFDNKGISAETELIGQEYETVPGGSAVAFCRISSKLGAKTAFIGMAGEDDFGDALQKLLLEDGIQPLLIRQPHLQTNIGYNLTSPEGDHIMLVAGTANAALSPDGVQAKLEGILPQAQLLYLGGCFKLKTLMPAFKEITALAKRNLATLVVDHNRIPQGTPNENYDMIRQLVLAADYYLPSRKEFCEMWGVKDIESGLRKLSELSPGLKVIVKDGAHGAYFWQNGAVKRIPASEVSQVKNVTSAGDTFNAAVIAALTKGQTLEGSIEYGCRVAAAKISGQEIPQLY